ncbi:MAG: tetratricopeptide repeat protein, partial [Gemmataceae bacterium]|nr:tetratricopeptide repeat protein [Gemmataceae bacterium]
RRRAASGHGAVLGRGDAPGGGQRAGDPAPAAGAGDRTLPGVERDYAQGLSARNAREALPHFRRVLEAEPFHFRASILLATTLLSLGRGEEAERVVRAARAAYPREPNLVMAQALARACRGDAALKEAEPVLPGPVFRRAGVVMREVVAMAARVEFWVLDAGPWDRAGVMARLLPALGEGTTGNPCASRRS